MLSGMCDVSRESCQYILTQKPAGNSIVIAVGGAAEALDAHPGSYTLTLKERKGFIKLAFKTGYVIFPCYCFMAQIIIIMHDFIRQQTGNLAPGTC